jgi:hypothetical protein
VVVVLREDVDVANLLERPQPWLSDPGEIFISQICGDSKLIGQRSSDYDKLFLGWKCLRIWSWDFNCVDLVSVERRSFNGD